MSKPAAFRATYSDFKLIKTRQCVQIIFEVPLADYDHASQVLGGMPNPASEKWFGIAPLVAEPEVMAREKKTWRDLQPSQQAAMRCNEPVFWAFLREEYKYDAKTSEDAAEAVREICVIKSRAELNVDQKSRVIWHQLDSKFWAWKAAEGVA